jgi:hypothetical protein
MKLRAYIPLIALVLPTALFGQDASPAQAQASQDVHFQIALAGDKHVFRAGEPVRIVLSFTADHPGYRIECSPGSDSSPGAPATDKIFITPESGLFPWLQKVSPSGVRGSDALDLQQLAATPVNIEIALNAWYRFDSPGAYTVHITTRRVQHPKDRTDFGNWIDLTSNYLSFEVQPMSDSEEEADVQRLSHLLDTSPPTPGAVLEDSLVSELSYLTGDTATREKVRRLLDPEVRGNHSGDYEEYLRLGLFQAKNPALAVQLLEAAIQDPRRPLNFTVLDTLSPLRAFVETRALANSSSAAEQEASRVKLARQYQEQYLAQVAATLPERTGENLTDTAVTILIYGRKSPAVASAVASARKVILDNFGNINAFTRDVLIESYWEVLRDPSLIPSLKNMLANASGAATGENSQYALKRLIELDPNDADRFVVAEICNPNSFMDLKLLLGLSVPSLPEADVPLLTSIEELAPATDNMAEYHLQYKLSLAARYATPAIYNQMIALYKSSSSKWQRDTRAKMLAYLLRYDEKQAIPLAEQEISSRDGMDKLFFSNSLVQPFYSSGTEAFFRKLFDSSDPITVGYAASILSQHGPLEDQALIAARLDRWTKEWTGRTPASESLRASAQMAIDEQLSLMNALLHAKSWNLTAEQIEQLKQKCVSDSCRQLFSSKSTHPN